MKKILKISLLTICCLLMIWGLTSCGRPDSPEDLLKDYIEPLNKSIEDGYSDFDIIAAVRDSKGNLIEENRIIYYTNVDKTPFLFISKDLGSTEGVDFQKLIQFSFDDVTKKVYEISLGEANTRNSEIGEEEFNNILSKIYIDYFSSLLPENADCITENNRIYLKFFGTYSNYEVRYKLADSSSENEETPDLYDCLLQFNTLTDKMHIFKAAIGEGDDLVSYEIKYNYPMLNANIFTKEIPTIDKMIENAQTTVENPTDSPEEQPGEETPGENTSNEQDITEPANNDTPPSNEGNEEGQTDVNNQETEENQNTNNEASPSETTTENEENNNTDADDQGQETDVENTEGETNTDENNQETETEPEENNNETEGADETGAEAPVENSDDTSEPTENGDE